LKGTCGTDGKSFFERAIRDVQMGYFTDPIYGGNRDMVGWRMIGYLGARYNYPITHRFANGDRRSCGPRCKSNGSRKAPAAPLLAGDSSRGTPGILQFRS